MILVGFDSVVGIQPKSRAGSDMGKSKLSSFAVLAERNISVKLVFTGHRNDSRPLTMTLP